MPFYFQCSLLGTEKYFEFYKWNKDNLVTILGKFVLIEKKEEFGEEKNYRYKKNII